MKRTLLAVWVFGLFLAGHAQDESHPVFSDHELYIGLTREAAGFIVAEGGNVNRQAFLTQFSGIISNEELGNLEAPFYSAKGVDLQWVLRISILNTEKIDELSKSFDKHPATYYAERVPVLYLSYTPNDLGSNSNNNQWHLYKIQAQGAWDISKGNKQVKVAIVDDAVQINHPDLVENIWENPGEIPNNGIDDDQNGYIDDVNGYDVGGMDNDPMPNNNNFAHGTHTAGISGATTNNNTGIASIGFGITIIPVKCTTTGQTNTQSIPRGYEGITYATAVGADIISCSWGSEFGGSTGEQVIEYAIDNGALVVAAMGNDNQFGLYYPASYAGVISVAATANNDTRSTYSNYHSTTVISAPGNYIRSTIPNNSYGSQSGTSMATPLVSGLLGLMKGHMYGIELNALRTCLINTADNIDNQNPNYIGNLGSGRINAEKALQCVNNIKQSSAPKIDFSFAGNEYCPGSSVQFFSKSVLGDPDSIYWEFPGGIPGSSTEMNPVVVYNTLGNYDVRIFMSNTNGADSGKVVNGVIVSDHGKALILNTQFETNLAGSIWTVYNQNASSGWQDYAFINGSDTNRAVKLSAYGSGLDNLVSTLTSAPIDFSGYGNPVLTFDFAYARRTATALDSLFIDVSIDGGVYFEEVYKEGLSSKLAVSGTSSTAFIPLSDAQWCQNLGKCLEISLKKYNRAPSVMLRIRHKGKSTGNNLYIDNILVEGNCAAFNTHGAIASTSTDHVDACEPVIVDFADNSMNFPQKFHWYFPGGTPSESTNPNEQVSYSDIGEYDVILVVENEYGKDSLYWTNKVQIHPQPTVTVSASDTLICQGESITLSADGAYTYTWSPLVAISSTTGKTITASPVAKVTYTVEGIDAAGCRNMANVTIDVLSAPFIPVIYKSGTRLYIPIQSNVSYQWYRNGEVIDSATTFEYESTNSGSYNILLTHNQTGCTSWGREPVQVQFVGMNKMEKGGYSLYPNPANSAITLTHSGPVREYKVFDAAGKLVLTGYENSPGLLLDVSRWAPGMYILEWGGEGQSYRDRFAVHH